MVRRMLRRSRRSWRRGVGARGGDAHRSGVEERILTPRIPEQHAHRRAITWSVFALVVAALAIEAALAMTGASSGAVRAVGIAVLVVCAFAVVGVVGAVLEATGRTTRHK